MKQLKLPKRYWLPLILMSFSICSIIVAEWQLEIIYIGLTSGWGHFDFPFYIFQLSFPVARDFWYLFMILSVLFAFYSGWLFGDR